MKNQIIPARKDQLINFVEKVWGHEEWIANSETYCGKKLVVRMGFRCSMHQHKVKDETFYLASGRMLLETEIDGRKSKRLLTPGDVQHITVGMWHRFTALEDSELFEFSTFHMDSDSYRREPSGSVDLGGL
ncbi:cupin domain-containing protein [Candidatus Dependentiae bacterium]|nr:cupin domain-containing protein [Candidatus Dependentiae bacterium]